MKDKIKKTLDHLKDFQRKTADYVVHQFDSGRNRMLIADEVGLGKTIVAKGIIARLFEKSVLDEKNNQFSVVYVCSNQAIAKANIGKLNFSEDKTAIMASSEDDRITSLAYEDTSDDSSKPFSIRAFTPATSFDDKTHAGRKDERVLLYRLLYDYADLNPYKNSLKWILKGNNKISEDTWENAIKDAERGGRPIRKRISSEFRRKMNEEVTPDILPKPFQAAGLTYPVKYWTLLKRLCQLEIRKNNYYYYDFGRQLISHLRFTLSQACISFLHADIFILDEFQRYKKIIENDPENESTESPAVNLARAIFSSGGKILMLSATPFKAYTNDFDEINGEVHQEEFDTVLKFLNRDRNENDWKEFNRKRSQLFTFLRHSSNDTIERERILKIKTDLEVFYRECMVRTERLSVSKDRNSLIKSMLVNFFLEPEISDLKDFVALDKLTVYLNEHHHAQLPIPLEYVKSSPYALSFLDGYQHRKQLKKAIIEDENLKRMLKHLKHAWLNLNAVSNYKKLSNILPNGKLRLLLAETIEKGAWKLLWIPPSMPYYEFGEPYVSLKTFSKVLVFSSWVLVPRMISTLVSYEAERKSIGNPVSISKKEKDEEKREYFVKRRHPRPQILYKIEREGGEPSLSQPLNIIYLYPSIFLAHTYDPERNLIDSKSLDQIRNDIKSGLKSLLLSEKIKAYATGKGDWRAWYWTAPLIFDKAYQSNELISKWISKGIPIADSVTDSEDETPQRDETSGKAQYFDMLRKSFTLPDSLELPVLTEAQAEKIAEYLTTLTLASPAICYLRTQLRNKLELTETVLDSSFEVASAFVTLFNKPENIAVIRLCTKDVDGASYLDRVLEYSLAGNIQAMLDEYFHLISESEGLYSEKEISTHISDVLSIRSTTTKVDDISSFLRSAYRNDDIKTRALRTHFAVDFAGRKLLTAKTSSRQINIRQAFNSPFRPFVLATTSIGQEGLDFHLYCRKIFHWNLPSNAIDIEQREGRINRYKGLVIRQNLVKKYSRYVSKDSEKDAWKAIFEVAEEMEGKGKGLCEMVPYWHTEADDELKIERFVPLYSFSRDIDKYNELQKILVYYRMTFGQPRQEELINAIAELRGGDNCKAFTELFIDLSPK